jgi:hypothetical protein
VREEERLKFMGGKSTKTWGPVVYYVRVTITDNRTGAVRHQRLGPFQSFKDAEMKKIEQEEARGEPGCEYDYEISPEAWPPLDSK